MFATWPVGLASRAHGPGREEPVRAQPSAGSKASHFEYPSAQDLIWRRRPAALPWGLFAAGQFCFLGLLGTTYNLQHGGYDLSPGMLSELSVNAFCLGIAVWLGVFLWRRRHSLGLET